MRRAFSLMVLSSESLEEERASYASAALLFEVEGFVGKLSTPRYFDEE